MTRDEISGMSEVNQTILAQVTGQACLEGAVVRQGSDRLSVVLRDMGPNTLRFSNLKGRDGTLFMNIAVRYQPTADTYDALVAHAYRRDNQLDIAYRYELIDGLYFDQFGELFAGEYCGDAGNAYADDKVLTWEKADLPSLLIFSASEQAASGAGYWSNDSGWVSAPKNASLFSQMERESIASYRMPVSAGHDAAWVEAASIKPVPPKSSCLSM